MKTILRVFVLAAASCAMLTDSLAQVRVSGKVSLKGAARAGASGGTGGALSLATLTNSQLSTLTDAQLAALTN